jgi:Replication-relaxation
MSMDKSPETPWSKLLILSERNMAIVRAIAQYRFMRPEDVRYSLPQPPSLSQTRRILSALAGGEDYCDRHILYRFPIPTCTKGTKPRVYALGVKGWKLLAQEGYYRPYKLARLSFGHLWHALTLTRFVCAADYYCLTHKRYSLSQKKLSYELAREAPTVTLQTEEHTTTVKVVPDAFLCFERPDGGKFPILLEIDRGTEYQNRFKNHARARLKLLLSGTFARVFQTPAVVVAYATAGHPPESRETRCAAMQRWTEEVITEMIPDNAKRQQEWLGIFRFCSLPEDIYANVHALFSAPVWHRLDADSPVPLLPTPQDKEKAHVHKDCPETPSPRIERLCRPL